MRFSFVPWLFLCYCLLTVMVSLSASQACAQQPETVRISGTVVSREKLPLIAVMVVNKRTSIGVGADLSGSFTIHALRTDTILVSAHGHQVQRICFRDSVYRTEYSVRIELRQLSVQLQTVSVEAPKTMDQVNKEIRQLGVKDTRLTESTVKDAVQSPITFLYERFSRFGQSKQLVAELENEDRKVDVLKSLFRIYIKHEIIDLDEEEFDRFIKYCNLSEEFIKTASEYELVTAIQQKYERFAVGK
jgi:hypothetical protein